MSNVNDFIHVVESIIPKEACEDFKEDMEKSGANKRKSNLYAHAQKPQSFK